MHECTCHIAAPCDFCLSLTEEEVDAFANGGLQAVRKLRAVKEDSNPNQQQQPNDTSAPP